MNETVNTFAEMSAKTLDAMRALGDINMRMADKLVDEQLKTFGNVSKLGAEQLSSLISAKDPREALEAQSLIMQKATDLGLANIHTVVELTGSARKEYGEWMEKGLAEMKSQAETVMTKTAA